MSVPAAACWVAALAACLAARTAAAASCSKPAVQWKWEGGDPKKPAFPKVLLVLDRPPLETSEALDALEKYRPHFWDLIYITPGAGEDAPWVRPPEENPEDGGRRLAQADAAAGANRLVARRLPYFGCKSWVPKPGAGTKDATAYICLWMVMQAAMGGPMPKDLANFRPGGHSDTLAGFLYARADVWLTPGLQRYLGNLKQPVSGGQGRVLPSACVQFNAGNKRHTSVGAAYKALEADGTKIPESKRFVCSMWNELVYFPKADARTFGKLASAMAPEKVISKVAMPTILAGMYGVRKEDDSGAQLPAVSYVACYDSGNAIADDNALNAWPCGHKIDLVDPCHRRFVSEVWAAETAQVTLSQVAEANAMSMSACKGRGGFYLEIDRVVKVSGTLGHPHVHSVQFHLKSGVVLAYGGTGGDLAGPWSMKPDEFISSVRQCDGDVGTLGRGIDLVTSQGRVINIRERGTKNSSCATSSLFRPPQGQQVVGLVFEGSRLKDVLTPDLTTKELYRSSQASAAPTDPVEALGALATVPGAAALLVTFLLGALLARLCCRAKSTGPVYQQVGTADFDDDVEVIGRRRGSW